MMPYSPAEVPRRRFGGLPSYSSVAPVLRSSGHPRRSELSRPWTTYGTSWGVDKTPFRLARERQPDVSPSWRRPESWHQSGSTKIRENGTLSSEDSGRVQRTEIARSYASPPPRRRPKSMLDTPAFQAGDVETCPPEPPVEAKRVTAEGWRVYPDPAPHIRYIRKTFRSTRPAFDRLRSLEKQIDTSYPPSRRMRCRDLKPSSNNFREIKKRCSYRLRRSSVRRKRRTKFPPAVPMNERGSGLRPRGAVQDFEKLRAECLESGELFVDPEFAAEDCSIFFSRSPPRPFEWLRPSEITDSPKFISEDASRFDVQQGELGDCWLLAAVANLTLNKELFGQIVPEDQSFEDNYAGIFHFRFWQYGRWVDVVIDDRLPTYNGQLAFMHSEDNQEFWSALLEKAYAKLHGSYEALKGGTTCEAMEDFSGGVTEMYEMEKAPDNLFQIVHKASERKSLMGCSIEPDPHVLEAELENGLIRGHAYSVTKVCMADIETPRVSGKIPMVRVRNPWGNEAEWKGAFSDDSPEWQYISEETRQEIGLTFDADGEFWMTFKDFCGNFQRLELCNLSPDSLDEDEVDALNAKRWEMSVFEGAWVRGTTAGGCRNYINTFCHNPQFMITLEDPDEDDDEEKCTVIVALMQKNRRAQRKLGLDCLTIGFAIYHIPDPSSVPKPLDTNFFRYNASVARAPSFINLREVSCRFKLPPGTYCIIPSTFEPNEQGEFLIRVFSEKSNSMAENDEEVGPGPVAESILKKVTPTPPKPPARDTKPRPKTPSRGIQPPPRRLPLRPKGGGGEGRRTNGPRVHTITIQLVDQPPPPPSSSVQPELEQESEYDRMVRDFFNKIAGDDLEIDWEELKQVLDYALKREFEFEGFSKDTCRSMIALMDVDNSGKLGLEEFKTLWNSIRIWKAVFKQHDADGTGYLDGFELRRALNEAGYRVNSSLLNSLMHRYGNKEGRMAFDDFMACAVKMKTCMEIFKDRDPENTKQATFSLEDWMEYNMYS